MSNVVIINDKNIQNQKINNIEKSMVMLPFHVNKNTINKVTSLFSRIKMTLYSEPDKLEISSLEYNNVKVKPVISMDVLASKMTLAKTYIATMKKTISEKASKFYSKIIESKKEEVPVFGITQELNLQEAFKLQQEAIQEATTEIDLTELNQILKSETNLLKEEKQGLSNNPYVETVIENPVNLSNDGIKINENVESNIPQQPVLEEPKTLVKSKKGNILVIPVIIVWLALVLFGTIKAVTAILS